MKAGIRIAAAIVVSLGITAALGAMQTYREFGHGFGHGDFCSRLDDSHVKAHADELDRWVRQELTLTEEQSAALGPVLESLADWAREMEPICANDRNDAPGMVAAAVQLTDVSQRAVARFATAFDALYATLDEEQRRVVDGWFTHEHGHGFSHAPTRAPLPEERNRTL
jgi:LTXXQ motif family protein